MLPPRCFIIVRVLKARLSNRLMHSEVPKLLFLALRHPLEQICEGEVFNRRSSQSEHKFVDTQVAYR